MELARAASASVLTTGGCRFFIAAVAERCSENKSCTECEMPACFETSEAKYAAEWKGIITQ
jgi:hypothetical protein